MSLSFELAASHPEIQAGLRAIRKRRLAAWLSFAAIPLAAILGALFNETAATIAVIAAMLVAALAAFRMYGSVCPRCGEDFSSILASSGLGTSPLVRIASSISTTISLRGHLTGSCSWRRPQAIWLSNSCCDAAAKLQSR